MVTLDGLESIGIAESITLEPSFSYNDGIVPLPALFELLVSMERLTFLLFLFKNILFLCLFGED